MKFAQPLWLFGASFALVVAALLVASALRRGRDVRAFGDEARVRELSTARPTRVRAWKGVAVVAATALAFVALARPQYGRGTRLVPATNLDVVLVVDYSKSMYARDVAPSRIVRAKAEIARLVRELAGARFGAVAFAGEPIAFPLTSDGAAIAQFFRQMEPNDMPVGGTAIARALERGRELLARDPKSKDHKRVLVLVTDGEDAEGDPVAVARAAGGDGTAIDVVQIGGRTPEPIPDVGPDGKPSGFRLDESGKPITTELSAEGEKQLGEIASVSGGKLVRSEKGATGIDEIARDLKRMQTEELAERVETVYADVYAWPLAAALLLLVIDTFLAEARRRSAKRAALGLLSLIVLAGCGWDPKRPFDRDAPEVNRAIGALDAGDASAATALLEDYLQTGACADGGLGTPERVRERPAASFDLGLALFRIGEQFGARFGDEESFGDAGPSPEEQELLARRADQVECALHLVTTVGGDASLPAELRARAHYLAGNLEFLRRQYEAAVHHYDDALRLVPGLPDGGDAIGLDAAWNRAIALRRIEDEKKKDAGQDGPSDAPSEGQPDAEPDAPKDAPDEPKPDAGEDGGQDAGQDGSKDSGGQDSEGQDAGQDASSGDDGGQDGGQEAGGHPPPPPSAEPPSQGQPPPASQDDRILDMLEAAPTFQQQDAKNRGAGRRVRGMVDK